MNADYICPGFRFAAVAAAIRKPGRLDLGLIACDAPAAAAGVFTRNRVQAAPVILDRRRLNADGRCQAVIVNSGCANCCTGAAGLADAEVLTAAVAEALGLTPHMVLAASTGVIGEALPVDRIRQAVPGLAQALTPEALPELAAAIMTTDTVPKLARRSVQVGGRPLTIVGVAKGAGMIRPDMATMLCFVMTDARAEPATLQRLLSDGVARSFNRISIDGDTSTNDTVLLLASGRSGVVAEAPEVQPVLRRELEALLMDLARQVVRDGEGATKLVEIRVRGALSDADAHAIADTVAHSNLVKTALFGQDANWGRILAAAGRAGAELDPQRIDLFFDDVQMVSDGVGAGKDVEARATEVLRQPELTITIDLKLGNAAAMMLTCDFSLDYVKINADYRS
jgi:glutamate N-acetyltransferase/amino-acid N-acetyltransferase